MFSSCSPLIFGLAKFVAVLDVRGGRTGFHRAATECWVCHRPYFSHKAKDRSAAQQFWCGKEKDLVLRFDLQCTCVHTMYFVQSFCPCRYVFGSNTWVYSTHRSASGGCLRSKNIYNYDYLTMKECCGWRQARCGG